jgi:hypothetical protein
MVMQWVIRLLAILAMALSIVGTAGLLISSSFLCFDVCPPDIQAQVLRMLGILAGPGLVAGVVVWGLSLVHLAGSAPRRRLGVAVSLPTMLVLTVALWLLVQGGRLLPTTESDLGSWARAQLLALVVQLVWLIYLFVAGSRTVAAREDAKAEAE